jgi:hypothetical protein
MTGVVIAAFVFVALSVIGSVLGMIYVQNRRMSANLRRSKEMKYYRVSIAKRVSHKEREEATEKDVKEAIGAFEQLLTGLHATLTRGMQGFLDDQDFFGFEISSKNFSYDGEGEKIEFFVICREKYLELIEKQITSFYQDATIEAAPNHTIFLENSCSKGAIIRPKKEFFYPIRTYKNLDTDPLNNLTNALSNLVMDAGASIQFLIQPTPNKWMRLSHRKAKNLQGIGGPVSTNPFVNVLMEIGDLARKKTDNQTNSITNTEQEQIKAIEEKSRKMAFKTTIRVASTAPNEVQAEAQLLSILSSFGQFEDQILNGFQTDYKQKFADSAVQAYNTLNISGHGTPFILNIEELASMFHFPNAIYNKTPTIAWQYFKTAPAPSTLPKEGILLGYNAYRGQKREIRFTEKDRFRHLYIIGQTGMGKSVLQKSLAKQDIADGKGLCVVDPHGDLIDDILEWIPPERVDDVIVFDPSDTERPIGLNLLEAKTEDEKDFIALDAMNMMIGLFGNEIFGPRLQDYFRNGCLTLMDDEEEGGALTDIVRLFTDDAWQKYKVSKVKNPIVKSFWTKQMAATGAREKEEMIPFLASKFGAFVTNSTMRNIVGQTRSSFDFSEIMDSNKILLVKLAKGLIGDINANLLGMIFVNKIQVAAMRRANKPSEERIPFFLYVDEFQNFVTDAFESILSEARKYKLGLTIAHQYIGQLVKDNNDKVKNAVFGNVGTMLSFKIGATDAEYMAKEMAPVFSEDDLINLRGFNAIMKLNTNNIISTPFSINTVMDFEKGNKTAGQAMVQLSRLKYGRDRQFISREILERLGGEFTLDQLN